MGGDEPTAASGAAGPCCPKPRVAAVGEGGWPRALRSPFPQRPPGADGFRDFCSGGGRPAGPSVGRGGFASGTGLLGLKAALPRASLLVLLFLAEQTPLFGKTLCWRQRVNPWGKGGCLHAFFSPKGGLFASGGGGR